MFGQDSRVALTISDGASVVASMLFSMAAFGLVDGVGIGRGGSGWVCVYLRLTSE